MSMFPRVRCLLLALPLLVLALPLQAWGPVGHRVVAELATRQLDAPARAEVGRLLAAGHAESLAAVANWPDQIRNAPALDALWKATRSQHYINFGGGQACRYSPPRDCPDGHCIIAGIRHYVAELGDRSLPDAERFRALVFVTHFIGDEHQPLHAGFAADKGGNTFQVQFAGRGSNLHKVWDSGLLATRHRSWQAWVDALAPGMPPAARPDLAAQPWIGWAEAACRIVAAPGFYPANHKPGQAYVDAQLPVAEHQLQLAGSGLAGVLKAVLGSAGVVPMTRPEKDQ